MNCRSYGKLRSNRSILTVLMGKSMTMHNRIIYEDAISVEKYWTEKKKEDHRNIVNQKEYPQ
jgi:hypothetical protein